MINDPQQPPTGAGNVDDLQFERVEAVAPRAGEAASGGPGTVPPPPPPGVTACAACGEGITDVYFEANGKVVCPRCRDAVTAAAVSGSQVGRFLKALVVGIGAGIIGASLWWGVRKATGGSEWGIIAVAVGFLVGGAVRYGSGKRGGRGYQVLAVILTYLSISANYVPDLYARIIQHNPDAPPVLAAGYAMYFALRVPFYGGVENIIGLLILAFALWEAWQINRSTKLVFNGPYRLSPAATTAPAGYGYTAPPPPMGRA